MLFSHERVSSGSCGLGFVEPGQGQIPVKENQSKGCTNSWRPPDAPTTTEGWVRLTELCGADLSGFNGAENHCGDSFTFPQHSPLCRYGDAFSLTQRFIPSPRELYRAVRWGAVGERYHVSIKSSESRVTSVNCLRHPQLS